MLAPERRSELGPLCGVSPANAERVIETTVVRQHDGVIAIGDISDHDHQIVSPFAANATRRARTRTETPDIGRGIGGGRECRFHRIEQLLLLPRAWGLGRQTNRDDEVHGNVTHRRRRRRRGGYFGGSRDLDTPFGLVDIPFGLVR